MSLVSDNIKYLRKLSRLTQEQFSRRIGIKRSLLGAYEEARANPKHEILVEMAKVFNVSVDMLLKQDLQRIRQTPELSIPLDGAAQAETPPAPKPTKPARPDNPFADAEADDPFALLTNAPDADFTKPRPAPRPGPRPNHPDPQPIAAVAERDFGAPERTRTAPTLPVAPRPTVVVPPVLAPNARAFVTDETPAPTRPVVASPPFVALAPAPVAAPNRPEPMARVAPVSEPVQLSAPPVMAPVPRPAPATSPRPERQPDPVPNRYESANYQPVAPSANESSVHPVIPYVQQFQLAEYRQRHLQPDYLSRLPTMRLPNLPVGHYRAFEADADFTFPGALLIGQFVRNWFEIAEGKLYVMLVQSGRPDESGVFCRRVLTQVQPQGTLLLVADRPTAPTREVALKDVLEVWEVRAFVSQQLPDPTPNLDRIRQLADELRYEVERLK